jgi:hypothetical protein
LSWGLSPSNRGKPYGSLPQDLPKPGANESVEPYLNSFLWSSIPQYLDKAPENHPSFSSLMYKRLFTLPAYI